MSILKFFSYKSLANNSIKQHLWSSAKVILGINSIGFVLTAITQTHKLTDLFGTGAFVVASWYSHIRSCTAVNIPVFRPTSSLLLTSCVTLWGTRLATYLFARILYMGHDSRLSGFFPSENEPWLVGPSIYPLKLAGFWTVQSLWPIVVLLPVFVSHHLTPTHTITTSKYFALFGFALGFIWETVADIHKFVAKCNPTAYHPWVQTGLYKLSRYPNYFGEIVVWASMCALASNQRVLKKAPWVIVSPIFVYVLLMHISGVPLTEKHREDQYGGDLDYLRYRDRTSLLIPWIPGKIQH